MEPSNYKLQRVAANFTLEKVGALTGYSLKTISALEVDGRGSDRLKKRLLELYRSTGEKNNCPFCKAAEARAEHAEKELSKLRKKLKQL